MTRESITKGEAAGRQVCAAIRMLLLHGEDILAVHTVAAAALSVLNDLAEAKGLGYTHETRIGLARLYQDMYGRDPSAADTKAEIERRASEIESAGAIWKHRNRIANFLKHADRDPGGTLDSGHLNTAAVISEALHFYAQLDLPLTVEMFAYMHWWLAVTAENEKDFVITKDGPVHLFSIQKQLDYGRGLLEIAYNNAGNRI